MNDKLKPTEITGPFWMVYAQGQDAPRYVHTTYPLHATIVYGSTVVEQKPNGSSRFVTVSGRVSAASPQKSPQVSR